MLCSVEASDTLSVIKRLQSELTNFIEPDFGLLDQLMSLKVLTRHELAHIRSDRTVYGRTEALLDLLTSKDQCDKFLKALKKTGQQHVVNYITQHGGHKLYHVIKFVFTLKKFHLVCLHLDIK